MTLCAEQVGEPVAQVLRQRQQELRGGPAAPGHDSLTATAAFDGVDDTCGDVFGLDVGDLAGQPVRGEPGDQLGVDEARADGAHVHAVRFEFLVQRGTEADDGVLGGAVGGNAG